MGEEPGADVVITMLTDAAAVDAVLFGTDGAACALRPGVCLVQMSTIGPGEIRDLAQRLPAGVDLVDAPVAGRSTRPRPAHSSCWPGARTLR